MLRHAHVPAGLAGPSRWPWPARLGIVYVACCRATPAPISNVRGTITPDQPLPRVDLRARTGGAAGCIPGLWLQMLRLPARHLPSFLPSWRDAREDIRAPRHDELPQSSPFLQIDLPVAATPPTAASPQLAPQFRSQCCGSTVLSGVPGLGPKPSAGFETSGNDIIGRPVDFRVGAGPGWHSSRRQLAGRRMQTCLCCSLQLVTARPLLAILPGNARHSTCMRVCRQLQPLRRLPPAAQAQGHTPPRQSCASYALAPAQCEGSNVTLASSPGPLTSGCWRTRAAPGASTSGRR